MSDIHNTGPYEFPATFEYIVDTGKRRYPIAGEWYCFRDNSGMTSGPWMCNESAAAFGVPADQDTDSWSYPPENYAIYEFKGK